MQCNQATQHNSKVLTELGNAARQENATLMILADQARQDSKFMKILSFVAVLYLPASLIAVSANQCLYINRYHKRLKSISKTIFSSNLMVPVKDNETFEGTRFTPATQFWVYPLATLLLMSLTVVSVFLMGRATTKRSPVRTSI